MRYEYNSELECFERVDGRGKKIWVTMNEAQRIVTMNDLGNSIGQIQSKMTFKSKKATGYSIRTILEKYKEGQLEIDNNAPASITDVMDLSVDTQVSNLEERMSSLERRIENIENILNGIDSNWFCSGFAEESKKEEGIMRRIKSWI